jgi:uncharacterized membrane protein YccC
VLSTANIEKALATMDLRLANLSRFFFSHYFFGGVRQGVGMMLPVLILGGIFGHYTIGMVATFGAQCLAIIDQPGGPRRHRMYEMLGGAALGALAVLITGLASTSPPLIWVVVIMQVFAFSMLTVFGKRGSLIGFAALLLMTLTMHAPLSPYQAVLHTAWTVAGSLFYLAFSETFSRLLWLREERQTLALALFSTAEYMATRATFYDEDTDLDDSYRALIARQSAMTDKQQGARDLVLRALPRGKGTRDKQRVMIWNIFVDMLGLVDTLVATNTDYPFLRRSLKGNDILVFMRDALVKMSLDLNRIAVALSMGRAEQRRSSVKAELRAIEYEIEQLRRQGLGEREPETMALIIQVLRRLRNAARIVERLAEHTKASPDAVPTDSLRIGKSLTRFLSRQPVRFGMITSNLSMDSPHFRYALRVTTAAAVIMTLTSRWLTAEYSAHNYWIMLTVTIIMKPGFALTRQRNSWRLTGTLIGCVAALALFEVTNMNEILFGVLIVACILGNSLVQINYMASAIFNTLFVVLVFHFVSPGTVSIAVAAERALDTVIGSVLAFLCSYLFPWWETRSISPLAKAAANANREYLQAGLVYVEAMQRQVSSVPAGSPITFADESAGAFDADMNWRLARKNVHIAFGNFAESFYRMMSEPRSHQVNVPEVNNLLIQNHVLASQITAAIPLLATLKDTPPNMRRALNEAVASLDLKNTPPAETIPLNEIENEGELATAAYPVKQLIKAAHMVRREMSGLMEPTVPQPKEIAATAPKPSTQMDTSKAAHA